MIKISVATNTAFYPKKTLKCPKCSHLLNFWNTAPITCSECKTIMPDVDLIMKTLHGKIEYHKCTKEKW